jgi:hypothetical protein
MTPALRAILFGQRPWSYMDWFRSSEQGAVYEADNPADGGPVTAYQESTGITPVTAPGQGAADCVIGLLLDKRLGLVLGSELVTNGSFSADASWTKGGGWTIAGGVATKVAGGASGVSQTVAITANRTYEVACTVTITAGSGPTVRLGNAAVALATLAAGANTVRVVAGSADSLINILVGGTFEGTLDNVSVRELPGNHATQATTASKPVLTARYNLLTQTEAFDNAAWNTNATAITRTSNQTIAPDGATTADLITADGTAAVHYFGQAVTHNAGASVISFYAKAGTGSFIQIFTVNSLDDRANFDVSTGAVGSSGGKFSALTIAPAANGFYRCTATLTAPSGANIYFCIISAANASRAESHTSSANLYLWGADLRTSADAALSIPAYQRVTDASNYDTAGFPCFFRWDGFDDSGATAAVDFTGTDKVTAIVGMHKASDAAIGVVCELSATASGTDGAFGVFAPIAAAANYGFVTRGTVGSANQIATTYTAPNTAVLACSFNNAGGTTNAQIAPRINGVLEQEGSTAGPTTAGNFGNHAINLGRRNNTNLPFSGRLYTLIICGAARSDAQIAKAERYVARKMKVTL